MSVLLVARGRSQHRQRARRGVCPAEVHQEARLFLYGPYFASSSFVWAVVGDSDDRAMAGLRALSEGTRMSRQTSGASATSASSQGSRGRRSSSTTSVDDFHIVESKDAIPPLAQLVKPTTSGVAKARASPFLCSMASKVARHEVGKGGLVVGPSSQPGLLFIRAGSLNMQAAGEKSSVVHAGTGIETAMVLEDEVVVCTGGSNETSTLLRDSFTLTVASDYAVYGFISRKDVEAIVAYVGMWSSRRRPVVVSHCAPLAGLQRVSPHQDRGTVGKSRR